MVSVVSTSPHKFRRAFYEPITPSEEDFAPDTPLTENRDTEIEGQKVKIETPGANLERKDGNLESQCVKTPIDPSFESDFWIYVIFSWVAIIFLVVVGTVSQTNYKECAAKSPYYSPLLKHMRRDSYEQVRFQGAMEHHNVYKGAPSRELDSAWEYLLHRNKSVVEADVINRINKPHDAVKYPEAQGGQYYVDIEIFHQMRCLNLIRQYTYHDYYTQPGQRPEAFNDPEPVLRNRVDHCIDMLRQALLCQSDVGLITANWVEQPPGSGHNVIAPDYSTEHKCRKFDKIVEWADRNAAPDVEPQPEPQPVPEPDVGGVSGLPE